jgi:hypothetical protein
VNIASRMESTSKPGRIQCSKVWLSVLMSNKPLKPQVLFCEQGLVLIPYWYLQDAARLLVKQDDTIPVRLRGLIQARAS